jgi:predicted transposase/invertase (TIGR01784 family)
LSFKNLKIAKTGNLTKEEHTIYEASLMQKWDYQNGIDFAVRTAVEKAVEKTVEKERAKAQKEKRKIAKSLKDDGLPTEAIAKATGLSIAQVEKL